LPWSQRDRRFAARWADAGWHNWPAWSA